MKQRQTNGKATELFPVLEMTCAACAASVESVLGSAKGVSRATVNFATHTAAVEFDHALTSPAELQQAVRAIGYDLVVDEDDP
ncbi:heavy metal-associated domain-containing protein, partial [Oscillatoria amoena NRMC-F 0135]|nr:heavy metal-associated domain-containing protein [Oscillatoria amoena NRMC-F 0135]